MDECATGIKTEWDVILEENKYNSTQTTRTHADTYCGGYTHIIQGIQTTGQFTESCFEIIRQMLYYIPIRSFFVLQIIETNEAWMVHCKNLSKEVTLESMKTNKESKVLILQRL